MTTQPNFSRDALSAFKDDLDLFQEAEHVQTHQILNIDISKYSVPDFSKGQLDGRLQYETDIQKTLKGITNPCIYAFEAISPNLEEIYRHFTEFASEQKSKEQGRCCPSVHALNKSWFENKKDSFLYVGKSEKPIDGRIVTHFGYYEKRLAGLQLVYWGKEIDLKLNLYVFEVTSADLKNTLEIFEKILFNKLNPLIGKR